MAHRACADNRVQSFSLKEVPSERAVVSPAVETAVLEPAPRTAWAEIATAELLGQLLLTVHHPHAFLDIRFRWITLASLARDLESTAAIPRAPYPSRR